MKFVGPTKLCALCLNPEDLCVSHIFPDFYIRSLERQIPTGTKGHTQPASILLSTRSEIESGQKQRGYWEKIVGLKERLLCKNCEAKFSASESWFREFFYGNEPGPLRKKAVGERIGPDNNRALPDLREMRKVVVDYAQYKIFVLSILWRASKAGGEFFRDVSLGAKHEEHLREILVSGKPGPEHAYTIVMIGTRHGSEGLEDYIEQPQTRRDETGYRFCTLVVGGFMFVIYIGSDEHLPPEEARIFGLHESGELTLLVKEDTARLQSWASRLGAAGVFEKIRPR